jgi:hypothetical protein
VYDDDEDEFGLPSLASINKRKSARSRPDRTKGPAVESFAPNGSSTFTVAFKQDFLRSDSYDIAEERNPLAYPSTKRAMERF